MIVGGYTLDLYCDRVGCTHGEFGQRPATATYIGQNGGECRAQARREGWKLYLATGLAHCQECVREIAGVA